MQTNVEYDSCAIQTKCKQILNSVPNALDGKHNYSKQCAHNALDGNQLVNSVSPNALDGKHIVNSVSPNALDGKHIVNSVPPKLWMVNI